MTVGTKSLLFGAHAFWLHPWFVAIAWWRLYGVPWDPRLWVAFVVHDWGYWGLDAMDDDEGELHPMTGALIMGWLFDPHVIGRRMRGRLMRAVLDRVFGEAETSWYCFVFYHSRFLAKRYDVPVSRLCVADKLALAITPTWVYVPMVRLTGEIREYRDDAENGKYVADYVETTRAADSDWEWHRKLRVVMREWVADNVNNTYEEEAA